MDDVSTTAPATRAERLALRVVQLGAIAVVLAATTHRAFDLDRFFVPKELVLHVTAALAGLLTVRSMRRIAMGWIDLALVGYLLLSIISAVLATNPWLAMRAVAISASGIVLFWVARSLREAGLAQPLLTALAAAVVLAAITSLLQAYGVRIDLFALNRAPGGTLGNRNFVAHAAAFGFPVVVLATLRAWSGPGFLVGSMSTAIVTASLVLTRSRAAWLAFAAMALVMLVATFRFASFRRLVGVLLFIGAGVAAALLLPNALRWRSDNPYLESIQGVVNYEEGSGRGRLIQYQRSLRMAATQPLFGVGPGNWGVAYPAHAPDNDPSLDTSTGGMTFNPWPSSDWVAFISERGFAATALMLFAFAGMVLAGLRRFDLEGATLLATVAAAGVAGAFDAVLLLPLPALIVWAACGATVAASAEVPHVNPAPEAGAAPRGRLRWVALIVIVLSLLGAARSTAQLVAMEIFATRWNRASLARAAQIDPGNYRLRLRLARSGRRAQRCEHALAARALYPQAAAARAAARGCGD